MEQQPGCLVGYAVRSARIGRHCMLTNFVQLVASGTRSVTRVLRCRRWQRRSLVPNSRTERRNVAGCLIFPQSSLDLVGGRKKIASFASSSPKNVGRPHWSISLINQCNKERFGEERCDRFLHVFTISRCLKRHVSMKVSFCLAS